VAFEKKSVGNAILVWPMYWFFNYPCSCHALCLVVFCRKPSCTRNLEPLPRAWWDTPAPQLPAGQSCRHQTWWVNPACTAITENLLFLYVLFQCRFISCN